MGVDAIAEVARIRRELVEFDGASSSCPVDRRRAQKQVEQQKREARESQAKNDQRTADQRVIDTWIWFQACLDKTLDEGGHLHDLLARIVGEERNLAGDRAEAMVKASVEEVRREYDAKLATLEQHLWQVATASHQGDDEAKRGVMIRAIDEVRTETRKWVVEQIEAERLSFEARLVALEDRLKSVPGKLPVAKTWREQSVIYQAEFVSHNGALYQARKDTATEPGGKDWIVVARAGRDGRSPTIRGKFDTREKYQEFDIVTCNGFAFTAVRDDPGICPGQRWEVSRPGRPGSRGEIGPRGPRGLKGMKGDRGDPALEIVSWHIDAEHYRMIPFYSNGKAGKEVDLHPLLERFLAEISDLLIQQVKQESLQQRYFG